MKGFSVMNVLNQRRKIGDWCEKKDIILDRENCIK